jgi:23S rRNA (uracil1939-C5)-methyltransferase
MEEERGTRRPDVEGLAPGREIEVDIVDLAFGGRGVARSGGVVLFAAGGLPGESARVRIDRVRRGYAEGRVVRILRAAPGRVSPRCAHYDLCGGCALQHLDPRAQGPAKERQVGDLLRRIGGLGEVPVRLAAVPDDAWRYRFRVDFDWDRDRKGTAILGLHGRMRPHGVVPIDDCLLVSEGANRAAGVVLDQARRLRLQPWDRRRRRGLLRRLTLQEARGTSEMLATLETGRGDSPALHALAESLRRRTPRLVGVVRREFDKRDDRVGTSILWGRDHLYEEVDGDRFRVPAASFFQPHVGASASLRKEALVALRPRPGERILELFCGVGFLTLPVARTVREVVATEADPDAVRAARDNAAAAGVGNCRFVGGDVRTTLPGLLSEGGWDALLLDPPRTGLPRETTGALQSKGPSRLAYVSCDPATLARDLKGLVMQGGYRVEGVVALDLFPQTAHVECVASLAR